MTSSPNLDQISPYQLRALAAQLTSQVDTMGSRWLPISDDRHAYVYSEHLRAFWQTCQDIGLERSPIGLTCLNKQETGYLEFHHSMNVLVARIRQIIRSKEFKRKENDRLYEASQKRAKLTEYVGRVLDRYSRTVVVRVDLHCRAIARARLLIEHVFEDLDMLVRARERNSIFKHETGYICSVEQGEDKGFHVHAAFFFNGAEVRSDFNKAREIGELWGQISRGYGYYHSCNHDKEKYKYKDKDEDEDEKKRGLGIGMIFKNDQAIRAHVHYAMVYLVKDAQHLRVKPLRSKCLRMGLVGRR